MATGPERAAALQAELERITAALVAAGALRVIVHGSVARGEVGPESDLDLLVVVPEDGLPLERRLARVYAVAAPRLPCDILPYSQPELTALGRVSDMIAKALREGRTVYARPGSSGV